MFAELVGGPHCGALVNLNEVCYGRLIRKSPHAERGELYRITIYRLNGRRTAAGNLVMVPVYTGVETHPPGFEWMEYPPCSCGCRA